MNKIYFICLNSLALNSLARRFVKHRFVKDPKKIEFPLHSKNITPKILFKLLLPCWIVLFEDIFPLDFLHTFVFVWRKMLTFRSLKKRLFSYNENSSDSYNSKICKNLWKNYIQCCRKSTYYIDDTATFRSTLYRSPGRILRMALPGRHFGICKHQAGIISKQASRNLPIRQ